MDAAAVDTHPAEPLQARRPALRDAFADRLAAHDTGKGRLRFRSPDRIDLDLIRDLLRTTASAPPGPVCA
ncbi:hypothetical protein ACWDYJ_11780 [Streptomyces sp. NPDC003042]